MSPGLLRRHLAQQRETRRLHYVTKKLIGDRARYPQDYHSPYDLVKRGY